MHGDWYVDSRLPDLLSCEELLTDPAELYLRQVTAAHSDGDVVYAPAFKPHVRPKGRQESTEERAERHKLSGARCSKLTPQGAYAERQRIRPSAGTWGVSVTEVEAVYSRLVDDSGCPHPEGGTWPTGHTYLDQRHDDADLLDQLRMTLAGAASRRKRLYPPSE